MNSLATTQGINSGAQGIKNSKPGQRIGRIKPTELCDIVLLVLLDDATLDPREYGTPTPPCSKRTRSPRRKRF